MQRRIVCRYLLRPLDSSQGQLLYKSPPPREAGDTKSLRDPKIRAHIAQSRQEFLAGKSRPFEEQVL